MKKQFLLLLTAIVGYSASITGMDTKQQKENMQLRGSIAPLFSAQAAVVSNSSITLADLTRMYKDLDEELSEALPSPTIVGTLSNEIQAGKTCPGIESIAPLTRSVNRKLKAFNEKTTQSISIFSRAGKQAIEKIDAEFAKENPDTKTMHINWRIALAARNNLKKISDDFEPSFEGRLEEQRLRIEHLKSTQNTN